MLVELLDEVYVVNETHILCYKARTQPGCRDLLDVALRRQKTKYLYPTEATTSTAHTWSRLQGQLPRSCLFLLSFGKLRMSTKSSMRDYPHPT